MNYTISEDKISIEIDGYQIKGEYRNENEPMYDFLFSSAEPIKGNPDTEMILYALLLREIEFEKLDFKFSKIGEFPYRVIAKLSIPTKYFSKK